MIRIIGLSWDEVISLIEKMEITGTAVVSIHGFFSTGTKLYNIEVS